MIPSDQSAAICLRRYHSWMCIRKLCQTMVVNTPATGQKIGCRGQGSQDPTRAAQSQTQRTRTIHRAPPLPTHTHPHIQSQTGPHRSTQAPPYAIPKPRPCPHQLPTQAPSKPKASPTHASSNRRVTAQSPDDPQASSDLPEFIACKPLGHNRLVPPDNTRPSTTARSCFVQGGPT